CSCSAESVSSPAMRTLSGVGRGPTHENSHRPCHVRRSAPAYPVGAPVTEESIMSTTTQLRWRLAVLAAALAAATAGVAWSSPGLPRSESAGGLTVHEWGTFLSVQGSNGVTL